MKHIKIDRPSGHLLLKHQARKRSPPDWSAIQTDHLHEISSRVTDDVDYICFRSVCSQWRSAAPKRPTIPWLVVEYADEVRLNSPNSDVHRSPDLPKGNFIIGSCRGWLSMIDEAYRISIHNPITGAHVRLPVIADMPWMTVSHPFEPVTAYWLVYRLLFSSHPMDDDCVFMALACNKRDLIYCRATDDCWSLIPRLYSLTDFIFYKGNCYAASNYRLSICDYQSQDPRLTEIPPLDPLFSDNYDQFRFSQGMNFHLMCFLVVSSGDLYLVGIRCPHLRMLCQLPKCANCGDFSCEVFRVDLLPGDGSNKPNLRLFKMQDLGGRAFFLGMKSMSVSVSPGDSPRCRPNCVYLLMSVSIPDEYEEEQQFYFRDGFIRDDREEIIVIFNMEDGSVSFRPVLLNGLDAKGFHWLTPSLHH